MKCIDCKHIKTHDKLSSLGFGRCTKIDPDVSPSIFYERNCKHFKADTPERVIGKVKHLEHKYGYTRNER